MSGYGTNTAEMATTANGIRSAADDVHDQQTKIAKDTFAGGDFGEAKSHQAHAKPFGQLLDKLADLAKAQHDAMIDYAGRLEGSKGGYEFSEDVNADTVSKAGNE